jgi:hypothetical protein
MSTQAPTQERDTAAKQPSAARAEQLRATAARIDDLLTDAQSALDRLMIKAAPEARQPEPSRRPLETGSTAMVVEMLLQDPVQSSATNEFENMLTEMREDLATDAEPLHDPHHDAAPAPHDDGRGVFALAMISLSILVAASLFGQHYAGVGVIAGANLLAWLVVVQHRRDAQAAVTVGH